MSSARNGRGWIGRVAPRRGRLVARAGMLLTLAAFLVQITACTSVRTDPTATVVGQDKHIRKPEGVEITGYVTTDGAPHAFDGRVALQADGSLRFLPTTDEKSAAKAKEVFTLAQDQVATLSVKRISPVKTTFAIIGGLVAAYAAIGLVVMLTKESCPFIYSFDGAQWVFDGEPYGAAISRGLARSDLSELEHLREDAGTYRLLLTNEVDETQHTDSLYLVVSDHPPGTLAVADSAGVIRAFGSVAPPLSARDGQGRDLSRWLSGDDDVAWQDDLAALAENRPLTETRDTLELEFQRPPGVERAWLVVRAANTCWASHMLRRTLDLRGAEVDAYYAGLDNDPAFRAAVQAWHLREEVFLLAVETLGPDGWREQARVVGGGPFIAERRALPLDLAGLEGDIVRVRLRPPLGFWSFDSIALAWDEAEVRTTVLAPVSALDGEGRDVTSLLVASDGTSLDFPAAGWNATLTFRAPAVQPGLLRTVFAATRGWYQIHLHGGPEPDRTALDGLKSQPGWIVNRALDEFVEFQRSGILAGTLAAAVPPAR